jgi:hypothetical protein
MKSILDRSFRYTKSIETDIRKTFARVRREQRRQMIMNGGIDHSQTVVPIGPRRRSTAP